MKVIKYFVFMMVALATLLTEVLSKGPNPYKVLGVSTDAT